MVEAEKIELFVCVCELTVRLQKRGIARHGLVQQVDRLQQICFQTAAETQLEKVLGAIVQIESNEIACWRPFNGQFLGGRNFCAKALSHRLRKLTLGRKHVVQI